MKQQPRRTQAAHQDIKNYPADSRKDKNIYASDSSSQDSPKYEIFYQKRQIKETYRSQKRNLFSEFEAQRLKILQKEGLEGLQRKNVIDISKYAP